MRGSQLPAPPRSAIGPPTRPWPPGSAAPPCARRPLYCAARGPRRGASAGGSCAESRDPGWEGERLPRGREGWVPRAPGSAVSLPPCNPEMWSARCPFSPGPCAVGRVPGYRGPRVSRSAQLPAVTPRRVLPPAVADRKPPSPGGKAPDGLGSLHGLPAPASTS